MREKIYYNNSTAIELKIMKKNHIDEEDKKQEKSKIIKALHDKWAMKNGYINNDRLNSQNTIGFKNGAER